MLLVSDVHESRTPFCLVEQVAIVNPRESSMLCSVRMAANSDTETAKVTRTAKEAHRTK